MIDKRESMTAKICSFTRAYHSNYGTEKIFDDYLAYDLMGKEEYQEIGQLIENNFDEEKYNPLIDFQGSVVYPVIEKYISPILISRVAYAENKLLDFTKKHKRCQYVICGAGMDTFSFRNPIDNVTIFELDHPDTQNYKLEKVRALEWTIPSNVHYVPIDFSKDNMVEVLKDAGLDDSVPTFFAMLGVTYYLTLPVFQDTLFKISQVAKNSEIVFDFPDATAFIENESNRAYYLSGITARLGEHMMHGYSIEDMENSLHSNGFRINEHMTPSDIQKQFFDEHAGNLQAYENIHFILAKKGGIE